MERVISFAISKIAFSKGFTLGAVDTANRYTYYRDDRTIGTRGWNHLHGDSMACVPQSFLQKWLRDRNIYVTAIPTGNVGKYYYDVMNIIQDDDNNLSYRSEDDEIYFDVYEDAIEEGLRLALKYVK
jgi:hypothetical protein